MVNPSVLSTRWSLHLWCTTGAALLTFPLASFAQTDSTSTAEVKESEANQAVALEVVTVTAQRSEESLSKTPVAVTALSAATLDLQGVRSAVDLSTQVPSLSVGQSGQIYLRGVGTANVNEIADPTVASHLDGVYLARPAAMLASGYFDMARVEVLRGPQGTLYGRNATAGSVNAITNKPEFSPGGAAAVEFGNYGTVVSSGMANAPLSDTVALRAAFQSTSHEGYVPSRVTGRADEDSADAKAGRVQLLVQPSEDFSVLLRGDYMRDSGQHGLYGVVNVPLAAGSELRAASGRLPVHNDSRYGGVSAEVNWQVGVGTLTYLGAYRTAKVNELEEYLPFAGSAYTSHDDKTLQQELRYVGTAGPLKFIGGLFYFDEKNAVDARFQSGDIYYAFQQDPTKATSYAGYAQGTYSITDRFRLTAGARYTSDEKSRDGVGAVFGPPPAWQEQAIFLVNQADGKWNSTDWKAGAEVDLGENSMLYGNVATGYKAGGYYDGLPPNNYDPEKILAYELGLKNRLLDGRLQLNLDAFYYDYKDLQVSAFARISPTVVSQITLNAGKARSYGFEAEGQLLLTEFDRVDLSLGLLKAEYTEFFLPLGDQFSNFGNPSTTDFIAADYTGNELAKSPNVTLNLGYQHTFMLGERGSLVARAQSRYVGKQNLDFHNFAISEQDSYTKSDVMLTYQPSASDWSVMAYVRNIEDEDVYSDAWPAANGIVSTAGQVNLAAPRLYGMRLALNFQ